MTSTPPAPPSDQFGWSVPALLALALVLTLAYASYQKSHPAVAVEDTPVALPSHVVAAAAPPSAPSAAAQPAEIEASHVLVMYQGSMRAPSNITRSKAEARTRAMEVLRKARAGEDFAGLARQYSDEPGAQQRAGALGAFRHGAMVPAFEQAAFALRVGQISDIVETPFGFHVIKRTR